MRRLNKMLMCLGCATVVNPYVIRENDETVQIECPTCSHQTTIKKNIPEIG